MDTLTKEQANYKDHGSPNNRCGVCMNYRVPNRCVVVKEHIFVDGICDWFNRDFFTVGNGGK